jgi:cytochrome c peroxidase
MIGTTRGAHSPLLSGRGPIAAVRALASVACVLVAACGDAAPGTGPGPDETANLRERARAAGLAALPTEAPRPVENPLVDDRVDLGHLLFFDPILSGPRDVACSTCHLPALAFTDGRQFPSGAGGVGLGADRTIPSPSPLREMPRNSPTVLNAGLFGRLGTSPTTNGTMFWGGTAFGIEDQTLNPISADNELRGLVYPKAAALDSVLARLRAIPGYADRFADAFPDVANAYPDQPDRLITATTLRRALAAYLRELVTPAAPFDAFMNGDDGALDDAQRRGLDLFVGKADCVECHRGPMLSDFSMHVTGAPQSGIGRDTTPGDDMGWGEVGGTRYAFRTPPLRQVSLTPPYFHAGTHNTLGDVVRFKNAGASGYAKVKPTDLDPAVRALGLTDPEIADLAAFLESLTDLTTIQGPLFQPPPEVPSSLPIPRLH